MVFPSVDAAVDPASLLASPQLREEPSPRDARRDAEERHRGSVEQRPQDGPLKQRIR